MNTVSKHPAFWMGMLMLGCSGIGLGWSPLAVAPWLILLFFPWVQEKKWKVLIGAFLLGAVCFFYGLCHRPLDVKQQEHGTCYFKIDEIKEEESPFGKQIAYHGKILHFKTDSGSSFRNIKCKLYAKKQIAKKGDQDYLIQGFLVPKSHGKYLLKPDKEWKEIEKTHSFAKWRFEVKQKAKKYLEKHFGRSKVTALFCALALGIIDDRQMVMDFKNLGLSHLLAISGFHFGLSCALFGFLLKFFVPKRILPLLLFLLCSAYGFFLGPTPSILRAWAAISLFLFAKLFKLRTTGLNALGFGLIVELLFDLDMANQIGFGLSFLATASILLLYSPCDSILRRLFQKRHLFEVEKFSFFEKHLYLLSGLFRKSIALNLSVHLTLLPASLFFFKSFPCMSLLYNLFFPFCIGLTLSLFFITVPIDLLFSPVGLLLHKLNHLFSAFLLDVAAYPPIFQKTRIHTETLTPLIFSLWLFILMLAALYFDKKREKLL